MAGGSFPKKHLVWRLVVSVLHVHRGVQAVVHVDGCFDPITVKVRELPGEQPGGLKASGHAPFLDQAEPALDHAVVLRLVNPRVLMVDCLVAAQPGEDLVHELGAVVRPKHLTSPPTSASSFFVAEATSAALLPLRG